MKKRHIGFLVGFLFLVAFPYIVPDPWLQTVMIQILFTSMVSLGCALLLHTGLISLCQGGLMGIGAYTTALLTKELGLSFWLALPSSALMAVFVAMLLGLPVLKLKSIYFIQASYAINEIIILCIVNGPWILGRHTGITAIPRPNPIAIPGIFTIGFETKIPNYYLILFLALLAMFIFYRLYVTHTGRVLRTIHVDETLAQSLGTNIARYKLFVFALAAFFAGLAGSFYAAYFQLAFPASFAIWPSIFYVMYPQVGGYHTIIGPTLGPAFFIALPEFLRGLLQWTPVVFGALIILSIFYFPRGLESLPGVAGDWIRRRRRERKEGD